VADLRRAAQAEPGRRGTRRPQLRLAPAAGRARRLVEHDCDGRRADQAVVHGRAGRRRLLVVRRPAPRSPSGRLPRPRARRRCEPDSVVAPAALSTAVIDNLLRKRLRFGGLAITDDLADPGVSTFAQVPDAAVQALQAGADMVYISGDLGDQEAAYNAVLNAV